MTRRHPLDGLDEDFRDHIERETQENIQRGMAPPEARRQAMVNFGNIVLTQEDTRAVWVWVWLDQLRQDVRYVLRTLRRSPGFATVAVLTLALGIGGNTAIFTVANGLLLRSAVGVADPNRLVDIVVTESAAPGVTAISYPDYLELGRSADTLEGVYGYELEVAPVSLRVGEAGAQRGFASTVTTNYFSVLGVGTAVGRTFTSSDGEQAGVARIVVLSHRFWMQRFKGDRDVVGQTVRLNGQSMTIVGVASEGFRGTGIFAPDVWVPTSMVGVVHPDRGSRLLTSSELWLMVGARLKPGVTRAQASSQISALGQALARERPHPATVLVPGAQERPPASLRWSAEIASPIPHGLRILAAGFLALLMAIVIVVLITALVLRQGMRLVVVGCAIGLVLGLGAGRLLSGSRFGVPAADPLVFAGAAALLIGIGFVACVVPVLRASRINPMEALRMKDAPRLAQKEDAFVRPSRPPHRRNHDLRLGSRTTTAAIRYTGRPRPKRTLAG